MVGSAVHRKLTQEGYKNILVRTSKEVDLTDQVATTEFFSREKPEYVFLAAAMVGGIQANNTLRAEFMYKNLMIQTNVIHNSYLNNVKKLLFLGSACIYPKSSPQPIKEEYLLTDELEPTNEAYAIAKIAGVKMCESYHKQYGCTFITVMPNNMYGPNDNYDLENSHLIAALIRKFHDAKISNGECVHLWGTSKPLREILHVNDLADACHFLMLNYDDPEMINVGTGDEITINELANLIKDTVGYDGDIKWDHTKPDGVLRKLLDISKLKELGFQHKISLKDGLKQVYEDFQNNYDKYTTINKTAYQSTTSN